MRPVNHQTQLWLDQIPNATNRYAIMAAALSMMLAIVVLYERMGWLT